MSQTPSPTHLDAVDADWNEIDQVIDQIAQLAHQPLSTKAFYAEVLDRVVSALAATGGIVWTRREGGRLQALYEINPPAGLNDDHQQLVGHVLDTGQPKFAPPHAGGATGEAANPTDFVLLLCPCVLHGTPLAAIEVFQRAGASPSAQQGYLHFLEAVCELVAEYESHHQLDVSRERERTWHEFKRVSENLHRSLKLRDTAYAVANDGRKLLRCDRLSVLIKRGRKPRVLAISGVDTIDRRSNVVHGMQKLAATVTATGEALWFPTADAQELAPEVEDKLQRYLDISHARLIGVVPLRQPAKEDPNEAPVIGALVVEQFDSTRREHLPSNVAALVGHCAVALDNALKYERIPAPIRALGKLTALVSTRNLPKTVLAAALIVAVVCVLMIPARFEIEARGELQPVNRREVFAPRDGLVSDVRVDHGAEIEADSIVAVLRDPALDLEFRRVLGERQTAQKRIAAIETERLTNGTADPNRYRQLTAEQEQLKQQIDSLGRQMDILEQQRRELEIRSPISGKVLTWDVTKLLQARPVRRGQVLLTVADAAGPWVLELELPDYRVKHLQAAQADPDLKQDLDVEFILATDPGRTYKANIEEVAMRTDVNESEAAVCRLTATFDKNAVAVLKPGTTVRAKIDCGQRALGYVWFHGLIEIVQSRILF
jgi:biotin carboxyl carrier protein